MAGSRANKVRAELAQSLLFGDSPAARLEGVVGPAVQDAATVALGKRLPANVYLGTSSWGFPGWQGLVWDRFVPADKLSKAGLPAYSVHPLFRTVGLDRTFYMPMPEAALAEIGAMVPPDFRFLVKAHQAISRPMADEQGQTFGRAALHTHANPLFLDAKYAVDAVVGPTIMGLGERAGPIVFQFPPMDLSARGSLASTLARTSPAGSPTMRTTRDVIDAFEDRLARFVEQLPREPVGPLGLTPLYGVEVRNAELLSERHASMLRGFGVCPGLAGHPTQPEIAVQVDRLGALDGPALVIRWLLHPSQTYEDAKSAYEPFDHLVAADPPAREQIANAVIDAVSKGLPVFVVVNNKAEGSAPRSIMLLAERIAEGLSARNARAQINP